MAAAVDDTDLQILAVLQDDGRISVTDLAARVHISRSAAYERLQRLRRPGIITIFSALVDGQALGLGLVAFVTIATEQAAWETVSEQLQARPEVEYAAATTGDFDALVLVRVSTLQELKSVVLERIHTIAGVKSTTTIIVLDEIIKRPSVLQSRGASNR